MYDLKILLIEITQKCNANCKQCGSNCNIYGEEILTKEDIINTLKDIKENIGTDMMINISGGEPLMRKDLFDIMIDVSNMGFDWGMVTNGVLISDATIEQMKKSKMKTITVSLDGLQRTHEELREMPNSFGRIIQNIKDLKNARFLDHLQVTFTANKRNIHEIEALYRLLDEIKIDSMRVSFIDSIGRAKDNEDLMLTREEIQYMIDFVNSKNRRKGIPIIWGCPHYLGDRVEGRKFECFTGKISASILYNGDIFVCPNVPRIPELIQGNIKKDSFSKIWKEGFTYFREKHTHDTCKNCTYLEQCGGDSAHTFDFNKMEPKFCYAKVFNTNVMAYEKFIEERFYGCNLIKIGNDDVEKTVYIEPRAYREIRNYFRFGEDSVQSMVEQQMGLIGFHIDKSYVIRYVFPSYIDRYSDKISRFNPYTISQIKDELRVIKENLDKSIDKGLYTNGELEFIGFMHSHPNQMQLQYSKGDEKLHKLLYKKYGDYIGIVTNPRLESIGAYGYEDIKQINLILIDDIF